LSKTVSIAKTKANGTYIIICVTRPYAILETYENYLAVNK